MQTRHPLSTLVSTATTSARDAPLSTLVDEARAYVSASRSPRTREAYKTQWRHFTGWCAQHGLTPLPASPDTVVLYLTSRAREGRKVATLAQALAAISQAHLMAGHDSPRSSAAVREAFKGIRRVHGSAPRPKQPLLGTQLQRIARVIPTDTLGGMRDRALLLLGFAGAFRRAELVSLLVEDVSFGADGMTVLLRRSKTDAEGRGRKVGIPFGSSAVTCPVRSVQAWLARAALTTGHLLRSVDRHGNVGGALSGRDVARIVKKWVPSANLDPALFAGHSLRSGLATSAAKAGKSTHAIMRTTGHHSVAMVQKYIRDAEIFKDNAADGLL